VVDAANKVEADAYWLYEAANNDFYTDSQVLWATERLMDKANDFSDQVERFFRSPYQTRRDFHELEDAFFEAHKAFSDANSVEQHLWDLLAEVSREMHRLRWAYGYGYRGPYSPDRFRVGMDFYYYP
jgi:hypothetical protein